MSTVTHDGMTAGGITYRQLDYWTRQGYLRATSVSKGDPAACRPAGGPGTARTWAASELAVARMMGRLTAAGLTVETAHRVARSGGDCELAPGIRVTVDTQQEAAGGD